MFIGLTGNIGSGKSTVAKIFEDLGYPVISSDAIVHELYTEKTIQKQILEVFNTLNRREISSMIFSEKDSKKKQDLKSKLENILHPAVNSKIMMWKEQNEGKFQLLINEVPLLFEAKLEARYDKIITVFCSDNIQIHRIVSRNPEIGRQEAIERINSQMSINSKIIKSDFIIENNSDLKALKDKVQTCIEKLLISNT